MIQLTAKTTLALWLGLLAVTNGTSHLANWAQVIVSLFAGMIFWIALCGYELRQVFDREGEDR